MEVFDLEAFFVESRKNSRTNNTMVFIVALKSQKIVNVKKS